MTEQPADGDEPASHRRAQPLSRAQQLADLHLDGAMHSEVRDGDVSLRLLVKEQARGPGYVADFIYSDPALPVLVYGVLMTMQRQLVIGEMELFRVGWGYYDQWGDFVGEEGDWVGKPLPDEWSWLDDEEDGEADPSNYVKPPDNFIGITGAVLRKVPVGRILAWAHEVLADEEWRQRGLIAIGPEGYRRVPPEEVGAGTVKALERMSPDATAPTEVRRGRPRLPDDLLRQVAAAYLQEARGGRGLTRRLAARFERPEETIRHWVYLARQRGFLTPARAGQRGAGAGPRLTDD